MANMNSGLNFQPVIVNPDLATLLTQFKKDIMLSLNCHAIATVQSVNVNAQTLTARINYTSSSFRMNQATGDFQQQEAYYPILLDCPFVVLGGGAGTLTFPITPGDQCLVLFNDRDIDNWSMQPGVVGPVNSNRLHSISDGIALVGLKSQVGTYDATRVVLRKKNAYVGVGDELIKIANEVTTLKTILINLISSINSMSLTGTTSSPGSPIVGGVSGVSGSVNSAINSLLE